MKVLLIGNYVPDRQESMQRFAALLESELKAAGHSVRLLQPRARLNRSGAPPQGKAKWLGYLDKFLLFAPVLRRAARRADIVHICDHSNAPYVRFLGNKPHLVTCHDVLAIRSALGLVPQHTTGASGRALQKLILRGLNRARFVVCDSQNTREQLLEVSTLSPDQLEMVFVGFNYPYSPMPETEAMPIVENLLRQANASVAERSRPYILHVGGNQWYKNRAGVLKIYRELREQMGAASPRLVTVGKPFDPEMKEILSASGFLDVVEICDVSNEELRALYSACELFIFPSLAEGFGWPVIEAQACGARVLTSNFRPLTEVGGEAAFYADPHDEAGYAREIARLLQQPAAARQASRDAGFKNVARFAPCHMTQAYLRIYREIIGR